MIKSGRLRYDSIEKLIRKYYKRAEVIYQSVDAEQREHADIEKMLAATGILQM